MLLEHGLIGKCFTAVFKFSQTFTNVSYYKCKLDGNMKKFILVIFYCSNNYN